MISANWCYQKLPTTPKLTEFNNFLLVCRFLGKNLSNFISPDLKLHNRYCHNENGSKGVPCTMSLYTFHRKILLHFDNFVSTIYFHIIVTSYHRPFFSVCKWKNSAPFLLAAFVLTTKGTEYKVAFRLLTEWRFPEWRFSKYN